ncbi:DUF167 domain-containing protein [Candidatus Bealeia paramacronuclearis]|uniref:DUF167 domain-containing protein n=1 Tax=Candidatus Bealeia paramacronuclearis TaxID=1921001 RepID=A0ABZ2C6L2_9PROT|nr:hypothetical protein [Candidatus Bealeia paramacronuclearis]
MRIKVRVIAGARTNEILELDEPHHYKVKVTTVPEKGKANTAVMKTLAKHFQVSASKIRLIKGETASDKIFEIIL